MSGLHPMARRLDQRIGRRDDMVCGTVVVDQEGGLRPVVRLEAADELHRGAVEGVGVLVIVSYRKEGELAVLLLQGSSGQCRYQLVLVRVDVLVLVHKDPAKAGEEPLALLVGFFRRQPLARACSRTSSRVVLTGCPLSCSWTAGRWGGQVCALQSYFEAVTPLRQPSRYCPPRVGWAVPCGFLGRYPSTRPDRSAPRAPRGAP